MWHRDDADWHCDGISRCREDSGCRCDDDGWLVSKGTRARILRHERTYQMSRAHVSYDTSPPTMVTTPPTGCCAAGCRLLGGSGINGVARKSPQTGRRDHGETWRQPHSAFADYRDKCRGRNYFAQASCLFSIFLCFFANLSYLCSGKSLGKCAQIHKKSLGKCARFQEKSLEKCARPQYQQPLIR